MLSSLRTMSETPALPSFVPDDDWIDKVARSAFNHLGFYVPQKDREDLLQEARIAVWESRYRPELAKIKAKRAMIDYLRNGFGTLMLKRAAYARGVRVFLAGEFHESVMPVGMSPARAVDPIAKMRVEKLLDGLSELERHAIGVRFFGHEKQRSHAVVSQYKAKALARLRPATSVGPVRALPRRRSTKRMRANGTKTPRLLARKPIPPSEETLALIRQVKTEYKRLLDREGDLEEMLGKVTRNLEEVREEIIDLERKYSWLP